MYLHLTCTSCPQSIACHADVRKSSHHSAVPTLFASVSSRSCSYSCSCRNLQTSDSYKILFASDLASVFPYKTLLRITADSYIICNNMILVTAMTYTNLLLVTADSYIIFGCQ